MYSPTILYRMVDTFCRYRKLLLLSVLVVSIVPMAYIATRKPTYTATALTQCVTNDVTSALGDLSKEKAENTWVSVAQQNMDRFNEWEQDDSPNGFLNRAFQAAKLDIPINVNPNARDPRLAAFRKGLSTAVQSDTIFSINLIWDRPAECQRIVQALQDQYVEEVGLSHQAQSAAAARFLDNELVDYKGRLRVAEQALIDFKQNNSGQSPEQQSAAMDQLNGLKMQLNDLLITSGNNTRKRQILQDRLAKTPKTSLEEQHMTDSPTMVQIKELQSKRNALIVEGWLSTSDKVREVDTKIKELQKEWDVEKADPLHAGTITETVMEANSAYAKLEEELTTATIDCDTESVQIAQLRDRIKQYETHIAQMPAAESALADKTRDMTILKKQYEDLLQRREQAQINMNLDKISATSKLRNIGEIYAQSTTSKSKKAMTLASLLLLGLVVGIATTLLAEWLDPSVRHGGDVEQQLGARVLIAIPNAEDLKLLPGLNAQNTYPPLANTR